MLFRGHKPEWLYEALPYIYIASGIVTASLLGNAGGTISGLLLISAGLIIWKLRRDYRAKNRIASIAPPVAAEVSRDDDGPRLAPMGWHSSYDMSHEQIDRQHRRLFVLGNDLIHALTSKKPRADIELMLDELLAEIAEHFKYEAEIMATHRMPLTGAHQEIHHTLLSSLIEMRDKFHLGQPALGELAGLLAYDAASRQLIDQGRAFAPAMQNA